MKKTTVDTVMDGFDFERVHKAMVALDWKWFDAENGVPSIAELRESSRKLLRHAINSSYRTQEQVVIGTGGFWVTVDPSEDFVSLEFILSRTDNLWDTSEEEDEEPLEITLETKV